MIKLIKKLHITHNEYVIKNCTAKVNVIAYITNI